MGAYSQASPFVECQAILAAQEKDLSELGRLLREMLPGERTRLVDAAELLAETAHRLSWAVNMTGDR